MASRSRSYGSRGRRAGSRNMPGRSRHKSSRNEKKLKIRQVQGPGKRFKHRR